MECVVWDLTQVAAFCLLIALVAAAMFLFACLVAGIAKMLLSLYRNVFGPVDAFSGDSDVLPSVKPNETESKA